MCSVGRNCNWRLISEKFILSDNFLTHTRLDLKLFVARLFINNWFPQKSSNLQAWYPILPVTKFSSKPSRIPISASSRWKLKTSALLSIRSLFILFGKLTKPCWRPQRIKICAEVLLCFCAIWTRLASSSRWAFANGEYASTTIELALQKSCRRHHGCTWWRFPGVNKEYPKMTN